MPEPPSARPASVSDDVHYRLLKILEERPDASQRQLSEALGVSLGKINYCVKALLDQGWIKATNFKNSKNKLAYAYLLTPSGIDAKARITARFLKHKIAEYEALKAEIEQLTAEVGQAVSAPEQDHRQQVARRAPLQKGIAQNPRTQQELKS